MIDFRAKHTSDSGAGGYLVFDHEGIVFHHDFTVRGEIHFAAQDIREVHVEDASEYLQRVTFTRLLFLRLLAFGLPKKSYKNLTAVSIVLFDGTVEEFTIETDNPHRLWNLIVPYVNGYLDATQVSEGA